MSIRKLGLAALGSAAIALAPGTAAADSTNGSKAITLGFSCDGQPLTFLIQGPGRFIAAKVLETGNTFIATSFTRNGTVSAEKQGPASQDQVTCTNGYLVVTGFFVPPTD
jgi:hypothetical protein